MKKILALTLALVMILGLAACGSKTTTSETDTPAATETAAATGLKIAIVTSPSGVDDGSFNQNNYEGIQSFIESHPDATVTPIQETDMANAVNAVADIVADYDVIVCPGFQFGGIITLHPTGFIEAQRLPTTLGSIFVFQSVLNNFKLQLPHGTYNFTSVKLVDKQLCHTFIH